MNASLPSLAAAAAMRLRCSMEMGTMGSSPFSGSGKLHLAALPRMERAAASYARAASSAVSNVPSHLHQAHGLRVHLSAHVAADSSWR